MWRYNRATCQWELVSLDGGVIGSVAAEVLYEMPVGHHAQFQKVMVRRFGVSLPARAFDFESYPGRLIS